MALFRARLVLWTQYLLRPWRCMQGACTTDKLYWYSHAGIFIAFLSGLGIFAYCCPKSPLPYLLIFCLVMSSFQGRITDIWKIARDHRKGKLLNPVLQAHDEAISILQERVKLEKVIPVTSKNSQRKRL